MTYQSLAIQGQALPVGFNEWLEQGRDLYARRKTLEWECADWLSDGFAKFPEQMTLAIQEFASDPIEQKALTKSAKVAASIPISQRNTALTFAHHVHVADLPLDELTGMGAIERVAQWHGCTMGEARDRIGAEMLRRTQTTDYAKG